MEIPAIKGKTETIKSGIISFQLISFSWNLEESPFLKSKALNRPFTDRISCRSSRNSSTRSLKDESPGKGSK